MHKYHHHAQSADQPRHLSEKDLARRWSISCRTLQRLRREGTGPAYLRISVTVRYALEDVEAYEAHTRREAGTTP